MSNTWDEISLKVGKIYTNRLGTGKGSVHTGSTFQESKSKDNPRQNPSFYKSLFTSNHVELLYLTPCYLNSSSIPVPHLPVFKVLSCPLRLTRLTQRLLDPEFGDRPFSGQVTEGLCARVVKIRKKFEL